MGDHAAVCLLSVNQIKVNTFVSLGPDIKLII